MLTILPDDARRIAHAILAALPEMVEIDKEKIEEIIDEHTSVTDEWGGSKLAEWKYGCNVLVGGIEEASDAIHQATPIRIKKKLPTVDDIQGILKR
jgi:hypothetical protein